MNKFFLFQKYYKDLTILNIIHFLPYTILLQYIVNYFGGGYNDNKRTAYPPALA